MKKTTLPIVGILALSAVALIPASAVAQIARGLASHDYGIAPEPVYHRGYRHGRVVIRRGYYGWRGPYAHGYADPGFAYHGNIPGCAVDLGYGRYESCNK
jgi:hypothetical protein